MSADFVALLRAVNVGGKNKLPMKALSEIVAALGCKDVNTFIQSGNVVFDLGTARENTLGDEITQAIHAKFGFKPPVILRSAAELARVVERNPFVAAGADLKSLHVAFLDRPLSEEQGQRLRALQVAPDLVFEYDREIYLQLPDGVHLSRLTNANFYSKIGVHTVRNWQTTLKLAEMVGYAGPAVG